MLSSDFTNKQAYYQVDLLSKFFEEAIYQLTYFSEIEKFERNHLQVESRHQDKK